MKGIHGTRKENLAKKEVRGINHDAVIFIFFLLLSFVLWYLNSLQKEIEADIRYPVKYINVPKGRALVENSQAKLVLYLKGSGYSILKLKVTNKKPQIVIDFSKVNYKRVPESRNPEYYIVTSGLTKSLAVQLMSGCEITSIKPDTLFFTLDKITVKSSPGVHDNNIPEKRKR
ncbi:MAG: hypothetical protein LLG13_16200 [Bacteroidales bacterium]|nr:hypothetical protein [Bacteroidales bacterium]